MFNLILGYNSRMTVSTPGKMAPFIRDKMAAATQGKMAATTRGKMAAATRGQRTTFSLDLQPLTEPTSKTTRGQFDFLHRSL